MKPWWTLAALPVASLLTALPQEPDFTLERVRNSERAPSDETAPGASEELRWREDFDRVAWKAALTEPDLDRREERFEHLVRRFADVDAARAALEDWSEDLSEPELAWTARLALRELRRAGRRAADPFTRSRLRAVPSPDVPFGGRPLGRDPFGGDWDALFGGRGGPDWIEEHFARTRELLEGLRGGHDPFGGVDPWFADAFGGRWGAPGSGDGSRSDSMRVEIGPDGVRVERSEEVDGERELRVYEAESLEQLLDQHPELKEHIEVPFPFGLRRRAADPFDGAPPGPGGAGDDPLGGLRRASAVEVPTHYLGVMMQEPTAAALRSGRRDVGLRVETVVPGTIAAELGLARGDVLLELNGRPLRSGEDVRDALARRTGEEAVELILIDASGEERTLRWNPAGSPRRK